MSSNPRLVSSLEAAVAVHRPWQHRRVGRYCPVGSELTGTARNRRCAVGYRRVKPVHTSGGPGTVDSIRSLHDSGSEAANQECGLISPDRRRASVDVPPEECPLLTARRLLTAYSHGPSERFRSEGRTDTRGLWVVCRVRTGSRVPPCEAVSHHSQGRPIHQPGLQQVRATRCCGGRGASSTGPSTTLRP